MTNEMLAGNEDWPWTSIRLCRWCFGSWFNCCRRRRRLWQFVDWLVELMWLLLWHDRSRWMKRQVSSVVGRASEAFLATYIRTVVRRVNPIYLRTSSRKKRLGGFLLKAWHVEIWIKVLIPTLKSMAHPHPTQLIKLTKVVDHWQRNMHSMYDDPIR